MFEKHTIGDSVYDRIKHDIVHLHFKPGEKLSEAMLSQKYGISRAPIRVALGRLKADGLIDIRPQSGSIVCPISIERAVHILDIRLLLEPYAIMQAIPKMTEEDIRSIRTLFDRLNRMEPFSAERRHFISTVDIELHNMILRCSGNQIIPEFLNRYAAEIQRVRRANIEWKNRLVPSEQEMRSIFHMVESRDAVGACEAMRVHLSNIRTALINSKDACD